MNIQITRINDQIGRTFYWFEQYSLMINCFGNTRVLMCQRVLSTSCAIPFNEFWSGCVQEQYPHPISSLSQSMYNGNGIGLIRRSSDDKRQLRLQGHIATSKFDNFVNESNWHIVNDEPTQVF